MAVHQKSKQPTSDGGLFKAVETTEESWHTEQIFVCSGEDFETLYPDTYAVSGISKVKLQMMRSVLQPGRWALGPSLCAELTLTHYDAFKSCKTLPALTASQYSSNWA